MIPYNQLSLADILQDCRKKFDDEACPAGTSPLS